MLADVTVIGLNFVFGDTRGNIGWQTTARVPVRDRGDGLVPFRVTDGVDNWTGWIPYEEMPTRSTPRAAGSAPPITRR
jgi:penicillin G amidase